jgi:hypothetical protein
MRDAVSKAYTQIFNSYHGWALRKAVSVRLHYIPTKQQLYRKLSVDGKYSICYYIFLVFSYNFFCFCSYDVYSFFVLQCIMIQSLQERS